MDTTLEPDPLKSRLAQFGRPPQE